MLTIIIVSWNVHDLLRSCLHSLESEVRLLASIGLVAKIIVVDSASTDGSANMMRAEFPQIELIACDENIGYVKANNLALRTLETREGGSPTSVQTPIPNERSMSHLRSQFVWLLNPDTVVHPGAMRTLVDFMQAHPRCGLCGPKLANADGSLQHGAFALPGLAQLAIDTVPRLQARLRDDPFLELAARREWAKMCRSISLGATAPGLPNLWLELRPTRAFAGQPRTDEATVTLTIGVQAQTRIVPNETRPDCPFPAQLELVPQIEQGRVNIAVPIDIPFTEVNRLLEAQLKGKTFPEDKSGAFAATVKSVKLAASGDRLLISLGVKANENKSWFGFGAEATIHVWGRPVLDPARQMLRLNDVALDVESQAAFGLLGAAAHAAVPYLEKSLAENAVVDLLPLANNARKGIEAALADFRKSADGVRVEAAVTNLRLVDIEFDAKTLRVIAEADGTVRVAVTALP